MLPSNAPVFAREGTLPFYISTDRLLHWGMQSRWMNIFKCCEKGRVISQPLLRELSNSATMRLKCLSQRTASLRIET